MASVGSNSLSRCTVQQGEPEELEISGSNGSSIVVIQEHEPEPSESLQTGPKF